jgi:hypothetical protein
MSRFLDLTHRPHNAADPHAADRLLPSFVQLSPFRLWEPGDPIPQDGNFILLGVATWSGYDMQLLDTLQEAMSRPGDYPVVALFNAGILTSMDEFYKYIPGVPEVFHTPVVGIWRDGVLIERAEGYDARDLVARMFGSNSDAVVAAVDRARAARAS